MQEIKVGDKIEIRVEVRRIIMDKNGQLIEVMPIGYEFTANTMQIEAKDILR